MVQGAVCSEGPARHGREVDGPAGPQWRRRVVGRKDEDVDVRRHVDAFDDHSACQGVRHVLGVGVVRCLVITGNNQQKGGEEGVQAHQNLQLRLPVATLPTGWPLGCSR
jgi:hypothetical protein